MAGTEPHSMLTGIIIFFICEIYALSVAVLGGSLVDILESTFYQIGWFDIEGTAVWGDFTAYNQIVNLFYLTPYVIGILGVVILIYTIWHRHGSDKAVEDEYYNNNL